MILHFSLVDIFLIFTLELLGLTFQFFDCLIHSNSDALQYLFLIPSKDFTDQQISFTIRCFIFSNHPVTPKLTCNYLIAFIKQTLTISTCFYVLFLKYFMKYLFPSLVIEMLSVSFKWFFLLFEVSFQVAQLKYLIRLICCELILVVR